jgi:hypothetical protein
MRGTQTLLTIPGEERSSSSKRRAAQTNRSSGDSERQAISSNAEGFEAFGVRDLKSVVLSLDVSDSQTQCSARPDQAPYLASRPALAMASGIRSTWLM